MTNERAQYEADQLHIYELEAANERLQAKITEFSGIILDYETKFDILAENEAKRCIAFGDIIRQQYISNAIYQVVLDSDGIPTSGYIPLKTIQSIDIKQLYTNFKKP